MLEHVVVHGLVVEGCLVGVTPDGGHLGVDLQLLCYWLEKEMQFFQTLKLLTNLPDACSY